MNYDTSWHYVGEAGEPEFQDGFHNYSDSYVGLRFMKGQDGIVRIKGWVNSTEQGASRLFILPEAYRGNEEYYAVNHTGTVRVSRTGGINLSNNITTIQDVDISYHSEFMDIPAGEQGPPGEDGQRTDFPIGYVYTQYPGKKNPIQMDLNGTWQNISGQFPGNFFRAEGKNASKFESGEQDDLIVLNTDIYDAVTSQAGFAGWSGNVSQKKSSSRAASRIGAKAPDAVREISNHTIRLWERTV